MTTAPEPPSTPPSDNQTPQDEATTRPSDSQPTLSEATHQAPDAQPTSNEPTSPLPESQPPSYGQTNQPLTQQVPLIDATNNPGIPTPPAQSQYLSNSPQTYSKTSGKAITSLVLGICGLVVFPIIPSVIAIIFGVIARKEIRSEKNQTGDGLALAGIITGIVGAALYILLFGIMIVILLAVGISEGTTDSVSYYSGYSA